VNFCFDMCNCLDTRAYARFWLLVMLVVDAGCWLMVAGCWLLVMLVASLLVAGCWLLVMLDAGWLSYWMLVAGCWLLVACHAGCWLLVILDAGCWMLVAGCWMLDVGHARCFVAGYLQRDFQSNNVTLFIVICVIA
jgi:hypothetical protein